MITCTSCVQALYPYIDRELSEEDIVQVRLHLDDCPGCLHMFQFQEYLGRIVRVRCREQLAPDSLRARIMASFQTERIRREVRRPGRHRVSAE